MDGGVAPVSPAGHQLLVCHPPHPQCFMAWPSADRKVSFQRVQQLPRNVANNYPETWSKPHFLCVLGATFFVCSSDEEQKPVDSVTLPPPRVMVIVTTL